MRKRWFPTVILSGFMGGTLPLTALCRYLRWQGIDARLGDSPLLYRRSLDHYVEDGADAIRAQTDPTLITIIGHSMGALAAVRIAAHPAARGRVGRVIGFGGPYDGTWAALAGHVTDRIGLTTVRELLPDSALLAETRSMIEDRNRAWEFTAINGRFDPLAPAPLETVDEKHCLVGPYHHLSILYDLRLLRQIASLVKQPA